MTTDTSPVPSHADDLQTRLIQATLGLLILIAPLFHGGHPPLALMLLQWLGLILIGLSLWSDEPGTLNTMDLILLPLLYLVPWPAWIIDQLPGREPYQAALATLGVQDQAGPISLHPFATESAWLTTLIPIGVYLATRTLPERAAQRLVYVLFTVAVIQVLIALFQSIDATSGAAPAITELVPRAAGGAGSYTNRNHLAGLLEMVLPLTLALVLFHFGQNPHQGRPPRGWRKRLAATLQGADRSSLIFVVLAIAYIVGIVLTRSRSGIALTMLGLILTAILFARTLGRRDAFGLVGRLTTLAIGFTLALGLAPILDRFAVGDMVADARWPLATATFSGAGRRLPLGTGPGTYPDAFPVDQPLALGQFFINRAHNDYLEALYETGLWAPLLILLFLGLYGRQWTRLVTAGDWSRFRCLQIGAGVGLALILGHSLTDYNLHTPANLAYFAFLAGLFFAPPGHLPVGHRRHRHARRTGNLHDPARPAAQPTPDRRAAGPRTRNPFDRDQPGSTE